MYKAKLWDGDKWNIHSDSYGPSKNEGISAGNKYHEQKYGSKDKDISSDYMKKEERDEKEENKGKDFFEDSGEEKKEQGINEEGIPFKAAKQIFDEGRHEPKKIERQKDDKTIEDAIKKAIEGEKRLIIMD